MTLLALAAAWVAGVLLADRFDLDEYALGVFLVASLLLAVLMGVIRRPLLTALLLVVLVLGMLRVEVLSDDETSALAAYHGDGRLQVQGIVIDDPEEAGAATRLRLRVNQIMSDDDWTEISGGVLVTLRESAELTRQRDRLYFRYGDRLLLVGTLESPPELEDFDYPAYLARQGIETVSFFPEAILLNEGEGTTFYRWLYSIRRSLADSLAQVLPEPQASLGQALLLGIRDDLPQDLVDDFRATGTSHVLAISGLHVGILLGISLAISGQVFGRRRQLFLVLPLVLMRLYALISGMSPSVTRAAIMGNVYLAAIFLGRPRSILPALGFAAAVMVAINPDVIGSVSFQLSFAAMAGITVLAEPLARWIQALYSGHLDAGAQALLAPVSYIAAMTIAATLAAVPLVAFHFQQVSLVGLPTTILVLPALPIVLILQAVSGLIGLLSTGLAEPLGWLAWLASAYVTGVVGLVARLPGASLETGSVAPLLVWAYYGILTVLYARASLRLRAHLWLNWVGYGAANNRTAPAGLRHPPRRTGRAAFTASGSPSDEIDRGREHRLFRHHRRVHTSLLRRSSLRSTPIRLPPFAMRPAFPTSDYYEGPAPRPALAAGWPTPSPESRTWFPSSRRLRLHAVLGPAFTPSLARCLARHRDTPVVWSPASLSKRTLPA